jgi:cell division protein FtsA
MQNNNPRLSVGIDIGTSRVRVVVGQKDNEGDYSIVGVGEAPTTGMRKGAVVDLNGPAKAVDEALMQAERMCGVEVNQAAFNINGSTILSTKASGMVAVAGNEVSEEDVFRLEDVAKVGKVPANRPILSIVPHEYALDGQSDIKDPIGMVGSRLEIMASVVSVMTPQFQNVTRVAEIINLAISTVVPSPVAAAQAVLSEAERENGVLLLDFGAATTGMAIYEEGDLKFVSVLPVGSNNLTNDLAIGLQTTPEVAEIIKLGHADAIETARDKQVSVRHNKINHEFNLGVVDEVAEARLDEIYEMIISQLKKAGYLGKLPSGVVLVGGGAKLKNITDLTKEKLGLATRLAQPVGLKGVADKVESPDFATAVGLMIMDSVESVSASISEHKPSLFAKLFGIFKSNH